MCSRELLEFSTGVPYCEFSVLFQYCGFTFNYKVLNKSENIFQYHVIFYQNFARYTSIFLRKS